MGTGDVPPGPFLFVTTQEIEVIIGVPLNTMISAKTISQQLEKILPKVRKPGRYTGGELNQVVKEWGEVETKIALLFPEIYDLGMSNMGLMILYDIINRNPDLLAERSFLPWTDMEKAMRQADIPLYSLETKHPLQAFDIIGISLPYESVYTNVLYGLDLARIPLYQDQRSPSHPLIIGGGHATFNPEPMAPFFDAFVIGEGEEVILEIIDCYQVWQDREASKDVLLRDLNQLDGVYIPSFYQPQYNLDGTFAHLEKVHQGAKDVIQKRIVGKLPPPPTDLIVPYVDIVHNRAPIEIMRGCTRGCRFCHAGMVNRPVRERPIPEIMASLKKMVSKTGYSEIGLLSLSSSDYTKVVELTRRVQDQFSGRHLSISLPSLRIESLSVELMDALADKRRSGFTLAPEAATDRLRKIINKPINNEQLLSTAREIYRRGWHTIKLYFMIGLPSERMDDVKAIADLSKEVRDEGEKIVGRRAKVHTSVSTFVPKPHTPFQWVPADHKEKIKQKIQVLQSDVRGWGLKLNWNDPDETIHEARLSRGDRRLSDIIYHVWEQGGKFDAWGEHFNPEMWQKAFHEVGLDPDFYAHRQRGAEERFPWDHIHSGVRKKFLLEDYQWSIAGKIRPDCRDQCYACGILPTYNQLRETHPGDLWMCPEINL